MKHPVPGAPSAWLPYVQVEDLVAATAKAKSLGATVMRDVTPVVDEGAFSIIVQPAPRWGSGSRRKMTEALFLSCEAARK